jgi:hypothetical protein
MYYTQKQYRRAVTEHEQFGGYVVRRNLRAAYCRLEVWSFGTLWLPVKEFNIIAESVGLMCTGSHPEALC